MRSTHRPGADPRLPPSPAGFTLAEILVALVVLEVGLLGAAGSLVLATRVLHRARDLEWAVQSARSAADSLVYVGATEAGEREEPFGLVRWSVTRGEELTTFRIVVEGRASARPLVDVSAFSATQGGRAP